MKKVFALMAMSLALVACNNKANNEQAQEEATPAQEQLTEATPMEAVSAEAIMGNWEATFPLADAAEAVKVTLTFKADYKVDLKEETTVDPAMNKDEKDLTFEIKEGNIIEISNGYKLQYEGDKLFSLRDDATRANIEGSNDYIFSRVAL